MPTSNEVYFDSAVRHQVGVRRFASGEVKRMLALLEASDRDLVEKLRKRLAALPAGKPVDFTSQRWKLLLEDIRGLRAEALKQLRQNFTPTLVDFSQLEVSFEQRLLEAAIPVEVNFAAVSAEALREIVFRKPFQGRLLREWYQTLAQADRVNLESAIKLGLTQGESIPTIVRRVAGTRAAGFTDGALSLTRRRAEAVVRTAVNHVSNAARGAFFEENSSVISGLRWTATLDGRTTPICRARDGKVAPVGGKPLPEGSVPLSPPSARPPAHVGCRSIMVAVIDGIGVLGNRPFVRDTRTPRRREVNFRRMARQQGRPIQEIRKEWAAENIGQMPAETTYNQFLRRQPAGFQDEVLGQTKGKLFRKGKLNVDQFVDRQGNELTLEELARTQPEAFISAGLKVSEFI
jgi:SPP1 gp7 family putative phage head morphogenesis protein